MYLDIIKGILQMVSPLQLIILNQVTRRVSVLSLKDGLLQGWEFFLKDNTGTKNCQRCHLSKMDEDGSFFSLENDSGEEAQK